jgi:hypothetical protein
MPSEALQRARRRHQAAMVKACPGEVSLGGVSYRHVAASIRAGAVENQDGGQRSTSILTVSIDKCWLATAPAPRAKVQYDGKDWIIETVDGKEEWSKSYVITAYL